MSKKKKKGKFYKYLTKPISGGATINNNNTNKGTPQQTSYQRPACHKGNTAIYKHPTGGTLYIGGWNNGATFDWNTHVIDLTGLEHKYWDIPIAYDEESKKFLPFLMQAYAGWLSLPFPDYGTPKGLGTKEQWLGLTETIKEILAKGNDVLVACHGGHGRSGLFVSIVGYILNIADDATWASPVEKVRLIHCDEAVETYAQEKYVYDILGLRIAPRHVYDDDNLWYGRTGTYNSASTLGTGANNFSYKVGSQFDTCPICSTQSLYVKEYGMCMTCRNNFAERGNVPVRVDLSLEDIEHGGLVEHKCTNERCIGIWQAKTCGHITHDMIIYDGLCEECYRKFEDDMDYAENKLSKEERHEEPKSDQNCGICGVQSTIATKRYGVCYECASKLVTANLVSDVHNSITDPYAFISHSHCSDEHLCVGIIRADVCQHVVHNREVFDGLCPDCRKENEVN